MIIKLEIKKVTRNKMYWSYNLFINAKFVDSCPDIIYRMWDKEQTALRNGIKFLNKHLTTP